MNIYKTVAVGLCAVVFGIMPGIANAQYDDYSFDGGFGGYADDYSFDGGFGGYANDYSFDGGFGGYADDYSFDGGWGGYADDYSFDGGAGSYFDDYSFDGGSGSYFDDYSFDGLGGTYFDDTNGGTYFDDYSFDGAGGTYFDDVPCSGSSCGTYYDDVPCSGGSCGTYYDDVACGSSCGTYYDDVPVYNADCGCYETSYGSYGSYGGFSMPFRTSPMTIVPPRYTPSYPSYPSYPTPRPTPTPAPTPTHTTITNTNTNTNINNNNVNTNTNVTTVNPITPGPIVQYVAPQYYPTYLPNYYGQTYYNQAPYCVITIGQGYMNGMISLTWSSQGATSAYITPSVGQVAPNGSTSLYSYGNTVYSMTVTGPGGTYTCRTQSYVAPYAPVSPYVSLTQIPYTGLAMGPIASAMYWTGMIALAVAGAYLLVYYKGGALALATSMISRSQQNTAEEEATIIHEEIKSSHIELPTQQNSAMTRDALKIVRSEDGTPRLVISRA